MEQLPPPDHKELHIWVGCRFPRWWRLMRNGFRHIDYWPQAFFDTALSALSTVLANFQDLIFRRAIERTAVTEAPLFVIGHWRSGTTFLFNLLSQDPRFAYPTHLDCIDINHVLLSGRLIRRLSRWRPPVRRAADDVTITLDTPDEDEFALALLGAPSLYASMAFPNLPTIDADSLDLEGMPAPRRAQWKRAFRYFVQFMTWKCARPLLLKSPTHTARIATLIEMFPRARFVHIVRDPYAVVSSSLPNWSGCFHLFGLQKPPFTRLESFILDNYETLFRKLEEGRPRVPPSQFFELRYEDLIADPLHHVARIYEQLDLGGLDAALPRIRDYLGELGHHARQSRPVLSDALREEVTRRCLPLVSRHGYPLEVSA